MSGTVTEPVSATATVATQAARAGRSAARPTLPRRMLEAFASLRLTVVLLVLAMVLVFVGTLAQVHDDIHRVTGSYFRTLLAWVELRIFLPPGPPDANMGGAVPFPGGYLLGTLLMVNLIAAHAVRFKLAARRAGILILHAGLIVLLLGELVTGLFAVETQMALTQGRPVNYVEHIHDVELAVVHTDAQGQAHETLVPASLLRPGERVEHPLLPFDLHVESYMMNSELAAADPDDVPADAVGDAQHLRAVEQPAGTGVDPQQRVNTPSAVVRLREGETGEPLGRVLASWWLTAADRPQSVHAGGRHFDIFLRYERTYLPYSFELRQFNHRTYPGTDIPRHFSSRLRLVDHDRQVDRDLTIEMNQPLRYAGRTFYQAAYMPDEQTSVLQVVSNPGWLIPYVAASLVAFGLLLQFALSLGGFLRKRRPEGLASPSAGEGESVGGAGGGSVGAEAEAAGDGRAPGGTRRRPILVPAIILLLATASLAWAAWPLQRADEGQINYSGVAGLPVLEGGRVKPLDSVARVRLTTASHQQTFVAEDGSRRPAIVWLLDVLAGSEHALGHRVYRIDHPQLLSMLDLAPRPDGPRAHRYRFSLAEIGPHWQTITEQAERARGLAETQRDSFDRQVIALADQLDAFVDLSSGEGVAVAAADPATGSVTFQPIGETPHHGIMISGGDAPGPPAVQAMLAAYQMQDVATFRTALARQRAFTAEHLGDETRRASVEAWFNHASPFRHAAVLYLVGFILLAVAWLAPVHSGTRAGRWLAPLGRSAAALTFLAFAVHSGAILARMWLEGRPPVTNLYASAVFVGWGCAGLGLILHRLWRNGNGLGIAAATVTGFASLLIAHQLAQGTDTLEPVRAVLDANFFMSTHVTTVTLGYTAMFVAGFLGVAFIARGLFTRSFDAASRQQMARMIYGVLCFALLLAFTGTMLGGIWADQAWGRFWGWDPKENGALLIVLWCALILHARRAGSIGPRGIALAAVFGNVITAWSWFGVNELGIGLHSYGFTEGAATALVVFAASQLVLIAIGFAAVRSAATTAPRGREGAFEARDNPEAGA